MKMNSTLPVVLAAALLASSAMQSHGAGAGTFPNESTFTNSLGMRFVRIEPGRFAMGNNAVLPKDVLDARLYGYMRVPVDAQNLQSGKQGSGQGASNVENQNEIAEYIVESMEEGVLYFLGPGTTVNAIAKELGIAKTLLGGFARHGCLPHGRRQEAGPAAEEGVAGV